MYEYANRLNDLGYSVHISYPLKTQFMKYRLPYWARRILACVEGFRTFKWFNFNPAITMNFVKSVEDKYLPDADIVITTWWATALEVGKLSQSKGKKINLIQGFENWEGRIDLLYSSYNMKGVANVVVASYLKKIVEEHSSNKTILIYNAVNTNQFGLSNPIETRNPMSICMNYSIQEIKGSKYGMEALYALKKIFPELVVDMFGVCPKPDNLPQWITFYRNPNKLSELYNKNAIFISNSLTEGFGLVSIEAMSCGCALVCTDIPGHQDYAIDNKTALLVEPKNPEDMVKKLSELIQDNDKRFRLAYEGNEYVKNFSWDEATERMNNLIKELLQE